MAETIECISPVDGRVYASRRVASKKEIAATFAAAHAAQEKWKRLPLAERAAYCSAAVDAMVAMTERDRAGAGVADGPAGALWRRRSCAGSRSAPAT